MAEPRNSKWSDPGRSERLARRERQRRRRHRRRLWHYELARFEILGSSGATGLAADLGSG